MPRRNDRRRGRSDSDEYHPGGAFVRLPHEIIESDAYRSLSWQAKALLVEIVMLHRSPARNKRFGQHGNNGALAPTETHLIARGFPSVSSQKRCLDMLEEAGLILKTRQGANNKPTYYALTWLPIDPCNGRHDVNPSPTPRDTWRKIEICPPMRVEQSPSHRGEDGKDPPLIGAKTPDLSPSHRLPSKSLGRMHKRSRGT